MTSPDRAGLAGLLIMIVEDDYHLAEELCLGLKAGGAAILGPAACVADALALLDAGRLPDAAVLDVDLGGKPCWPVADHLLDRGVPVLLASGYDAGALPGRHAGLPRCEKPFTVARLAARLTELLAGRADPAFTPAGNPAPDAGAARRS